MTNNNEADSPAKPSVQSTKSVEEIIREKISIREELIEKLNTLLSEAHKNGIRGPGRGGLSSRQKWFSISSSLAHSLARLLSDLEYEKMRLDVNELKKLVLGQNVASQRFTLPQPRHGSDKEERGQEQP